MKTAAKDLVCLDGTCGEPIECNHLTLVHPCDPERSVNSMKVDYPESDKENKFRFEIKTFGEWNKALKILDCAGFDYKQVEDLRPFVVKLSKYSKYAPLLKNSIAFMETPGWRIFLMKDLATVEEDASSRFATAALGHTIKYLFKGF